MPASLALASACTYGFAGFLGGFATRKAAVIAVTLISNLAGAGAAPLLAARATSLTILIVATFRTRPSAPAPSVVSVAVVAGVYPTPTVLLAVALLGERLDRKQAAGLVLAVTAAALLS